MSCVDLQYISSDECIGASLPKINGNFAALSAAVCELSSVPAADTSVNVFDSPTIDLNWNASTRTLSGKIVENYATINQLSATFIQQSTLSIYGAATSFGIQPAGTYEMRYVSGYVIPYWNQPASANFVVVFQASSHRAGDGPRLSHSRFYHQGGTAIEAYYADNPYGDNSGPGVTVALYKINYE